MSDSKRPTKELTTPAGHKLVLKEWLSARERNDLRRLSMEALKMGADGSPDLARMDGGGLEASEKKLVELAVVSYHGLTDAEAIMNELLDGPANEYDFVTGEAVKINQAVFQQPK